MTIRLWIVFLMNTYITNTMQIHYISYDNTDRSTSSVLHNLH